MGRLAVAVVLVVATAACTSAPDVGGPVDADGYPLVELPNGDVIPRLSTLDRTKSDFSQECDPVPATPAFADGETIDIYPCALNTRSGGLNPPELVNEIQNHANVYDGQGTCWLEGQQVVCGFTRDIEEHQAYFDDLTGVPGAVEASEVSLNKLGISQAWTQINDEVERSLQERGLGVDLFPTSSIPMAVQWRGGVIQSWLLKSLPPVVIQDLVATRPADRFVIDDRNPPYDPDAPYTTYTCCDLFPPAYTDG